MHKHAGRGRRAAMVFLTMACAAATMLTTGVASATEPTVAGPAQQTEAQSSWPGNSSNPYGGQDYYIDATGGADTNAGTSQDKAWKTLSKANVTTFKPGDRILLKAGEQWNDEQLWPKGSGAEGKPITISAYGSSEKKPYIATNGKVAIPFDSGIGSRSPHKKIDTVGTTGAITLRNQEYWEINNVELSNDDDFGTDMTAQNGKIWDGISVSINADLFPEDASADDTVMDHFRISDVYIHNTDSADKWQSIYAAGIDFQVFGDKQYDSYPKGGNHFNDVRIENNTIEHVDLNAIQFGFNWMGKGGNVTDETGKIHEAWEDLWVRDWGMYSTDTYIGHNYIESTGQGAIQIGHVKDLLAEYNEINGFLKRYTEVSCALYAWASANVTMQYNEVYDGPANQYDGTPWDLEYTNFDVTYQFNYSHDNKAGWMAYMGNSGNSIARYNLSVNDNGVVLKNMLSSNYSPSYFLNNVIVYDTSKGAHFHDEYLKDTIYWLNNVFYNKSKTETSKWSKKEYGLAKAVFSNNDFYETSGKHAADEPADEHKLTAEPRFAGYHGEDETPGGKLSDVVPLFLPSDDSPLIDAGRYNAHMGTADMLGTHVYYGDAPDIGILETQKGTKVDNPVDENPVEVDSRNNLALNKPVTASSEQSGFPASNLVDGNESTKWAASKSDYNTPITIDIDFGESVQFNEVDASEYIDNDNAPRINGYSLWAQNDGQWSKIYESEENLGANRVITFGTTQTASKLRFQIDNLGWASCSSNIILCPGPAVMTKINVYNNVTHHPTATAINDTYNLLAADDDTGNVVSYRIDPDGDELQSIRWVDANGNALSSLDADQYTVADDQSWKIITITPAFLMQQGTAYGKGDYGIRFDFASGATAQTALYIIEKQPATEPGKDKPGTGVGTVNPGGTVKPGNTANKNAGTTQKHQQQSGSLLSQTGADIAVVAAIAVLILAGAVVLLTVVRAGRTRHNG